MAPVAGRPFVEWVVRFLARQGVRRVVLSTGYRAEALAAHFHSKPVPGVQVDCIAEPAPLGTAGGFLHAARSSGLSAPAWLVLNGDSLALTELAPLATATHERDVAGAILGLSVPDAARYGSLSTDPQGRLLAFAEKRPGAAVISAGIYVLRGAALDSFPPGQVLSFERDVFPGWLSAGKRIQVVSVEAPFLDIGTEETLGQAEEFIGSHPEQFLGKAERAGQP